MLLTVTTGDGQDLIFARPAICSRYPVSASKSFRDRIRQERDGIPITSATTAPTTITPTAMAAMPHRSGCEGPLGTTTGNRKGYPGPQGSGN